MSRTGRKRPPPSPARARLEAAVTAHRRHDFARARELYEQVLRQAPGSVDAMNLLAVIYGREGRFAEGQRLLERAIELKPDFARAWLHLGNLLQEKRDHAAALEAFDRVLALEPGNVVALVNKGNCLRICERHEEARAHYEQAVAVDPNYSLGWANLSKTLMRDRALAEARDAANRAITVDETPVPLALSAWLVAHEGVTDSATLFRRTAELFEHPAASGELLLDALFMAHHCPEIPADTLLGWHRRAADELAAMVSAEQRRDELPPRAARPRRFGFLSASFQRHPVGYMTLGVIEALAAQGVEVFLYAIKDKSDDFTQRFQAAATRFLRVAALSDETVVQHLRDDGLDVLFDLSGITNGGRPRIAAMRGAPLQIKWVGGQFGPSSMPNVDAFLTDPVESPARAQADHDERLLRMPTNYATFLGDAALTGIAEPPSTESGVITFGSLNKLAKINDHVIDAWSTILTRVPASRLLIRNTRMDDAASVHALRQRFGERGIDAERLILLAGAPHDEYVATYNRIDVTLDTFPYTGGLTTCESLWMGVPVVTLAGRFFSGRHAATHLSAVGLPELVCERVEAYVETAVAIAGDAACLKDWRRTLRARVEASPLCDYRGFAASLVATVDAEWARRFAGAPGGDATLHAVRRRHEAGDSAGALKVLIDHLNAAPPTAEALVLAGEIAAANGDTADAVNLLRRAVGLDPESVPAHRALLAVLERIDAPAVAAQVRERLAQLGADDAVRPEAGIAGAPPGPDR